ncbi:MAG: hypothetical protein K2X38_10750 [Gemmataceae bacterium]|nr:hypothetical protein [Gemmataceae bacterium]
MDETPPIAWLRWLLMPAFVLLVIPALLLVAAFLVLRAVAYGVAEAACCMLPWRRAETGATAPQQGPHFAIRTMEAVQEKLPTQGA